MIKYFQYNYVYVKNDEVAKMLTKVINSEGQKAISTHTEIGLYDSMIQKSNDWIESDAATFDSVKNQVITYLQSI